MISGRDFRTHRGLWAMFDGGGNIINYYNSASDAQAAWSSRPANERGTLVKLPDAVYVITKAEEPETVLRRL